MKERQFTALIDNLTVERANLEMQHKETLNALRLKNPLPVVGAKKLNPHEVLDNIVSDHENMMRHINNSFANYQFTASQAIAVDDFRLESIGMFHDCLQAVIEATIDSERFSFTLHTRVSQIKLQNPQKLDHYTQAYGMRDFSQETPETEVGYEAMPLIMAR